MKPKIFLGADHAGFELKEEVKAYLRKLGYEVEDRGAFKLDAEDDYPDFISAAAREVAKNLDNHKGIIFGGSGQGEAMVANKIKGIRAAVFNSDNPDIVKLSRLHNDSNVLSIGARFVSKETVAPKAVIPEIWILEITGAVESISFILALFASFSASKAS